MARSAMVEPVPNTSTNTSTRYWFKRRRYGIGWIPATPRGWISLAAFAGALALPKLIMNEDARNGAPGKIWKWGLTAGYLGFIFTRSPRPKWRWGSRPDDNPLEDA